MAGLKKQQDLADKRQSTVTTPSKSIKPVTIRSEQVKTVKLEPKPKPKPKTLDIDKDWLVANLDVLLPPLSKDDLDELEDEDDIQDASSSAPIAQSSSPRLPSPRSASAFGHPEGDESDEMRSPPFSPTRCSGPSLAEEDINEHEALDKYDQQTFDRDRQFRGGS